MRFTIRPRRHDRLPDDVRGALGLGPGERVLSWSVDETGTHVVATNHRLCAVEPAGSDILARPWHLVDGGRWDHDAFTLTVTWVDGQAASRWLLSEPRMLPETVRERVQASVVLAEHVELPGRRSARVVVRSDLATGRLLDQTILGPGARAADPEVARLTGAVRESLREQVGLL